MKVLLVGCLCALVSLVAYTEVCCSEPSGGNKLSDPLKYASLIVYFEAGCPYCTRFFAEILRPACDEIGSILMIDFVPWGNAHSAYWDKYDRYGFECQHGIEECATDMFLACALKDENFSYYRKMELNLCVMGYTDVTDSPFLSWRFCAEYANVDYDEIVKCMSGKDGEAALMEMKNLTAANPHYRGTPSLSLNGDSGVAINDLLLQSEAVFIKTVCKSVDPVRIKQHNS
ncbi:gamma-interferon-inducible lysosomal thiol reductase-like [Convolutriloba macropyga]|uniref:gamma-interferon-inducible lysosomal thiol reductase-like n=1 Tax=Convolutriloba macropyga TaxID=536237 RepID=UPI003F520B11